MLRKVIFFIISIVIVIGSWNYISLQKTMSEVINSDPRNEGVNVFVHYEWFVNPNIIIFDIRAIDLDTSSMDVSRLLLQLAEKLKDKNYQSVVLAFKSNPKFILKGDFFKSTGLEYGVQNPVYTLRSFPQNVYNLNGEAAFPTWSGGMLGVLGKQMEDLNEFHKQWYLNELLNTSL